MRSPISSVTAPIVSPVLGERPRTPQHPMRRFFRNDEVGVWYDPSDLSTLFQDSAGSIPVTGPDQSVGLMLDKSGNGHHAWQSAAASKPVLRESGGLYWLECDGVDDYFNVPNLNVAEGYTALFALSLKGAESVYRSIWTQRDVVAGPSGDMCYATSSNRWEAWHGNGVSLSSMPNGPTAVKDAKSVVEFGRIGDQGRVRLDDGAVVHGPVHSPYSPSLVNGRLLAGGDGDGVMEFPAAANFYGCMIVNDQPTSALKESARRYTASKMGLSL